MVELNCHDISTTITSLANLFQLDAELLEEDLGQSSYLDQYDDLSNDMGQFSGEESPGLYIYYRLLDKYGHYPLAIDRIHWFHGTRTLFSIDDYRQKGILPGSKAHPILFARLKQWAAENKLEFDTNTPGNSSYWNHKQCYPEFTEGPYAIAVAANHEWPKSGLFSYTNIPEIVSDFFSCYGNASSLELAYKNSAKSYIIEFWDKPQSAEQEHGCILSALHWCTDYLTRGDQSIGSLYLDNYDGQGKVVPPERIIRIEPVTTQTMWLQGE